MTTTRVLGKLLRCQLCRAKGYTNGGRVTLLTSPTAFLSYPVDDRTVWLSASDAVCTHHQPLQPQPALPAVRSR